MWNALSYLTLCVSVCVSVCPLPHREGAPDEETEHQLPKEKLLLLTSLESVTDYVSACDYLLYECIVDFLIPNVLRPIPGTLTQAIRNFAKSLEMWLTSTIHGYSPTLIKSKVTIYIQTAVLYVENLLVCLLGIEICVYVCL